MISILVLLFQTVVVVGFVPTDCYEPCTGGNCRYDDCKEPVDCAGGLCYFYDCYHPTCDGGACTFERCWMPSCKGGACTNINPLEAAEPKAEYVAYRVSDTSSGGSPSLRGAPVALSEMARFEDGRLPPPPPPNRGHSDQIGDPEELERIMLQQEVEAKMLSDLRLKQETGVIKSEEVVQLKYLEARAESEKKKKEWEAHQREVEKAYEDAKRAQEAMEEERRKAEEKRLQEEAEAFAKAEAERLEREALEEAARQQAAKEAAQAAYQKQLEEQAAYHEEERLKREEMLRLAAVQDRLQARLAQKEVREVTSIDSLTALKERLGKFSADIPKLDFKPISGGALDNHHPSLSSNFQSSQSLLNKLNPSSSSKSGGEKSLFEVVNENSVCSMPMLSFEVAVFALSLFLSDMDFDVVDFLKLTEKFFGIFIALIGAVSIATPGGELVMLCCVHEVNDLVLRTWFMLFMLVLCIKAIFESYPERHERWLRLLQVACTLFVADCFVLHQHICHITPELATADSLKSSAMYIWAGCIFYLVYKIEDYLDAPTNSSWDKWRRWDAQVPLFNSSTSSQHNSRYRFDSDNSVDICEVDEDEEENGYKSKSK